MKLKDLTLPIRLIDNHSHTMTVWRKILVESQPFYQVLSGESTYLILISELELVELLQTYTKQQ